jgi:hypothetical protein
MIKNLFEKFMRDGHAHVLYALLVEVILLILLSFAGLFTLETILPGIISSRFIIGKLIIIAVPLIFFTAFLGRVLGISFSTFHSSSLRILIIGGLLWTLGISILSLLAFPIWSIPIFLISFATIGYLVYKELKN